MAPTDCTCTITPGTRVTTQPGNYRGIVKDYARSGATHMLTIVIATTGGTYTMACHRVTATD